MNQNLQERCIDNIVEYFDSHYQVFSSINSDDVRYQFLQKCYSSQLIEKLSEDIPIPEKYAAFLFNKNLKTVDTEWFEVMSWETIIKTFAEIGPVLEKVFFTLRPKIPYGDDKPWIEVFCHLPNVKIISCQSICYNGILESIAKYCPKLEKLDVSYSDISHDGLKHFYEKENEFPCPLLTEIYLDKTFVHVGDVMDLLKKIPFLKVIGFSDLPTALLHIYEEDLSWIDEPLTTHNLTHLDLQTRYSKLAHTVQFDQILYICAQVCPELKSLHCPIYSSKHLELCSLLTDLEDLNLICVTCKPEIADLKVNDFLREKGRSLTSLSLCNCNLSLSTIGLCSSQLKQLTLNMVNIEFDEKDGIPVFYALESLTVESVDLSNSGYSKAICHILTSSPQLKYLFFKRCKALNFSPETKAKILKCCEQNSLKFIGFAGPAERQFLQDILITCSSLETLRIDRCFEGSPSDFGDLLMFSYKLPNNPTINYWDVVREERLADTETDSSDDNMDIL